jgi:hypothetical protein
VIESHDPTKLKWNFLWLRFVMEMHHDSIQRWKKNEGNIGRLEHYEIIVGWESGHLQSGVAIHLLVLHQGIRRFQ